MNDRSSAAADSARLRLLGDPAVVYADGRIKSLERRAAGLLALVALEPGVTRARAAALLWPESDNARQALRQQIARFRRNYGAELVRGDDALFLVEDVAVDAAGDAAGELLGTLSYDDCADFADWLAQQRQRRRGGVVTDLAQQLAAAEAEGNWEVAVQLGEQLLVAEADSEAHHRTLMRLHYLRGDVAQAQAAYERLVRQLRLRFGAQPSEQTETLARTLRSAQAAASRPVSNEPSALVPLRRPPRLIGRRAELAQLAALWNDARTSLLLGEPGLGKSRLLAEFASGRRVLLVQGRPGDAGVPYATLARLLRSLMARCDVVLGEAHRVELARLLPELAPGSQPSAQGQRLALQQSVERLLADARLDGAAIEGVIVDDLHFADDATLEMLQALVSGLTPALRFAFAQRPGEGGAAAAALRDVLEEGGLLTPVALAPLSEAELDELLASLQIQDLDVPRLAAALARHTGGNPLFALETVKQGLASGQLRAGRLPQPASVGTLIERRLKQLSDKALALARVAAIAGPDFSTPLAEHATGERAIVLADAWNELQEAQVLRDTAFAHDLVADAVLRSVPTPIARHLHGQIAQWLCRHDGEPARTASHWEASGEPSLALPEWHRAAERALAALRPREAVEFLQRALAIETDQALSGQTFETLARIVQLRLLTDQSASLAPLIDRLLAEATTARQRITALLAQADLCTHRSESLDLGLAAAQQAHELAAAEGDKERETEAQANLAVLLMMNGNHAAAVRSVERFLPRVRDWPAVDDRCNMLGKAAYVLARSGRTQEAADLFDEAARGAADFPRIEVVALANAAQAQLQMNRPKAALERLQRSNELRAAHDELGGSGHSNGWMLSWAYRLLGRYADALAALDTQVEEVTQRSPGKLTGVLVDRACVWLDIGQTARALQDRDRARRAGKTLGSAAQLWMLDLRLAGLGVIKGDEIGPEPTIMTSYARVHTSLLRSGSTETPDPLTVVRQALEDARRFTYRGLEASALARLAYMSQRAGDVQDAIVQARQAVALAEGRNTDDQSWPELALRCGQLLQLSGCVNEARMLFRGAADWLNETAATLPPPFRASLLERHPVHRLLLQHARRG